MNPNFPSPPALVWPPNLYTCQALRPDPFPRTAVTLFVRNKAPPTAARRPRGWAWAAGPWAVPAPWALESGGAFTCGGSHCAATASGVGGHSVARAAWEEGALGTGSEFQPGPVASSGVASLGPVFVVGKGERPLHCSFLRLSTPSWTSTSWEQTQRG